jgi:hypothetical protein
MSSIRIGKLRSQATVKFLVLSLQHSRRTPACSQLVSRQPATDASVFPGYQASVGRRCAGDGIKFRSTVELSAFSIHDRLGRSWEQLAPRVDVMEVAAPILQLDGPPVFAAVDSISCASSPFRQNPLGVEEQLRQNSNDAGRVAERSKAPVLKFWNGSLV